MVGEVQGATKKNALNQNTSRYVTMVSGGLIVLGSSQKWVRNLIRKQLQPCCEQACVLSKPSPCIINMEKILSGVNMWWVQPCCSHLWSRSGGIFIGWPETQPKYQLRYPNVIAYYYVVEGQFCVESVSKLQPQRTSVEENTDIFYGDLTLRWREIW